MKIDFTLGKNEKTEVIIERNWFTGSFVYFENRNKQTLRSSLNPTTHFSIKLNKTYEFNVGKSEPHKIRIEHIRPRLLAGFRPQKFEIFVNETLHETYKGY